MNCEIIAVGTEILLGDIVNTNAQYIARGLSSIGIGVYYQTVVGDNPARLDTAVSLAKSRADMIITTGGLGPTYDDLTKEVIAKNFGAELELHEPSLKDITDYMSSRGHVMTENNKKQAYLPKGCVVLKNDNGTAPGGIITDSDGKIAVMLPGPPREMKPMFDSLVLPYLMKYSDGVIFSRTLRVVGVGESLVETKLRRIMTENQNPSVAPYAKDGECIVRITAKAADQKSASDMISPIADEIYFILGNAIYGEDDDTIEGSVIDLLTSRSKRVAFAESCTGGLLSKRLTDIPGASECFDVAVTSYSNDVKHGLLGVRQSTLEKYGAVSFQCAVEMSRGMLKLSGADYAVSVTGIAGPGGGSEEKPVGLVYVAVTDGHRTWVKDMVMKHRDRDRVRTSAANMAFDMLRRMILTDTEA